MTAADAARLRAVALAYPEATEDFPWGHTAVKVRGSCLEGQVRGDRREEGGGQRA